MEKGLRGRLLASILLLSVLSADVKRVHMPVLAWINGNTPWGANCKLLI
jgi:hypothetical protein